MASGAAPVAAVCLAVSENIESNTADDAPVATKQENDKLRNKLHFYENPHTPPSVTTLKKNDAESKIDSTPKKRGAPKGHRGATRPTPIPDETKDIIAEHCEKCGSPNLKVLDSVEKTVIEEMLPPKEIKTTQYDRWKVE